MTARSIEFSRRAVLRAGAVAALAAPLAACSGGNDESPDPLAPLLAAAEADAAAARALGADAVAGQVAEARAAHAAALKSEVDRLNRPPATPSPAPAPPSGVDGFRERLVTARKQAEDLVGTLPRYRAGLAASIAAGCAALQRAAPALGPGEDAPAPAAPAAPPTQEVVGPLQRALAAEHAAVWVYGLVSAYLPAEFGVAEKSGMAEHAKRRDLCQQVIASTGTAPVAPEPAYVPPKPVTDSGSAAAVIATAESDATAAWLDVLTHTDDTALRRTALAAMVAASRRCTPWRAESGEKPTAVALPGQAQSR
ncbi:ferritin-like domain-containing protein [Amycolatopsis samaneae]|uniref:Ferritin-like domain-containing protein n=1 Tax=Amycolatopsis samaneae TaxID=664691 RepID=A0ABW5GYI7_9PSEU